MSIRPEIHYAKVDELYLDPLNPRLGRHKISNDRSQDELLNDMRAWSLEDLAMSYLESGGFWINEALLVVKEEIYGADELVVVEGNRRLAALKYLKLAVDGEPTSPKWKRMVEDYSPPNDLFESIPFLISENREGIKSFLGFRHVTGIKQWDSDEKAGFISELIEKENLDFQSVAKRIGSKTPTVRRLYIAYKVLLQIEDQVEEFEHEWADKRFSILYMLLAKEHVADYLGIDLEATPEEAQNPVPRENSTKLNKFSKWIFGDHDSSPILTDTRQVELFNSILASEAGLSYLESHENPKLATAMQLSGGEETDILESVQKANFELETALTRIHAYTESNDLKKAVKRLVQNSDQLKRVFQDVL